MLGFNSESNGTISFGPHGIFLLGFFSYFAVRGLVSSIKSLFPKSLTSFAWNMFWGSTSDSSDKIIDTILPLISFLVTYIIETLNNINLQNDESKKKSKLPTPDSMESFMNLMTAESELINRFSKNMTKSLEKETIDMDKYRFLSDETDTDPPVGSSTSVGNSVSHEIADDL